jgi:phenylpropionate dioxygenase-like ring-hydroxylating dioxygenase large terminal subunit
MQRKEIMHLHYGSGVRHAGQACDLVGRRLNMNDLSEKGPGVDGVKRVAGDDWPSSWRTMPHGISVGRYTDAAFAALEFKRLWSRVWQAAARLDEIPEAGDFTVYTIGDQAVLLVRVDVSTVKAYPNACPHRGTALGDGCGTFKNGKIICPFHGWRWDLTGKNEFVLERQEFRDGQLHASDIALKQLRVELFAGFVFINFDSNPVPFDEFIAPVRQILEGLAVRDMRHYWWKAIPVRANWKVAAEAFLEGYHVPATHPQLEATAAEVIYGDRPDADMTHRHMVYIVHEHGHGHYFGNKSPMAGQVADRRGDPVDDMVHRLQLLVDGMDAMVLQEDVDILRTLRGKTIPAESSLGAEYVEALYAAAAKQNRPMPERTPEILKMWGGEVFVFPNLIILSQAGNAMIYRVLPDPKDPDRCTFEIRSTKSYPVAVRPPRAVVQHVSDLDDPKQVLSIPRQDLGNIPRIQKGLHSRFMRQTWLAAQQEKLIPNLHRELDRYLLD